MPHNAFWGRSAGQVNVTRAGFALSYFVSHTCWQPLPQRVNSVNANDGTAAGIKRLRRLKFKRCGELASRLSSRLTFAYVYVVVREIHLGRPMPSGTPVRYAACLDEAISAASSQGKANTDSDGGAPCLDELHESDEGGMFPVCITVMLSCVVGFLPDDVLVTFTWPEVPPLQVFQRQFFDFLSAR